MKWIGQHIWDFISRFRSDVYLEATETGTIASGGNLGLDSNNKIVKAAEVGSSVDLTSSEVTGVLTVDHGGTGLSSIANNNLVTGNGSSALTAESSLTYDSETLTIGNDDDGEAHIKRLAHSDDHGGPLVIRGGDATAGQTDKHGGHLKFYGGQPTGDGDFGNFKFFAGYQEGSGTSLRTATQIAQLESTAATSTDLTIYEKAGASSSDYFKLSVAEHGATTLSTLDASATAANLNLEADGDINNSSTTNKINKTYDFHGTTFENTYSDGEASGTILKYSPGADDTITGSNLAYLRSNTGQWATTDADQASTSTALLGVGLGGSAQTVGLLLEGFVRIASTEILNVPGSGEVDGLPVYVSTTAGHFDFTAPSGSGDIVRIVGYAIDDDSGDVLIYFKPDNTWVEIA